MSIPPRAGGLRFLRYAVLSLMVMTIVMAVLIAVAFVLNADRVDQINQERAANVERNCEDVNRRHDRTLEALDQILARRVAAASPADRARLRESRATTALLINALVPRRDCGALAAQQVTSP